MSNTTNQSVVSNFEALSLFFFDFDVWSAQRSVSVEDLKTKGITEDQLPPQRLATLGRKQFIDTSSLKPFTKLRTRARRIVEQFALPVRGGWLLPQSKIDSVYAEFDKIRIEFEMELDQFLASYKDLIAAQKDEFPEWAHMIDANAPDVNFVRSRFNVEYEDFKIEPGVEGRAITTIDSLGNKLLDEIVQKAMEFWKKFCQPERLELAATTAKTITGWKDKVEGLAFISSENFDPVVELLNKALKTYEIAKLHNAKAALNGDDFVTVKAVLAILMSPAKLELYMDQPSYFDTVVKQVSGLIGKSNQDSELLTNDSLQVSTKAPVDDFEEVDVEANINALKEVLDEPAPVETQEIEFEEVELEEVQEFELVQEQDGITFEEVPFEDFEIVHDEGSEFTEVDEELVFDFDDN